MEPMTFDHDRRPMTDSDRTLLRNSIDQVVDLEFSDGNRHQHTDLPMLVAGGANGRLKGGRHIRYPRETPLANLHLTLLDNFGVKRDRMGDSTGRLQKLV